MTKIRFSLIMTRTACLATLFLMFVSLPVAADSQDSNSAQKAVLITGASTGIGRRTTELLASKGYFVYAGARKQKDMNSLNTLDNVQAVRLDVTVQEEIDAAVETGVAAIAERISALAAHARARAAQAGLALFSPADIQSGINSFLLPADAADRLAVRLAEKDIVVKFPEAWNEPYLAPPPEEYRLLRISPHIYNNREEIDAVFDVLETCL